MAGRCRSRCSARWPETWSRCTASPTSCGCSGRPSSGPRSTGSPARGARKPLAEYRAAYERLARGGRADLADLAPQRARAAGQEADLLRFGLDEIEAVDPQPGEDAELRAEEAAAGACRRRCAPRAPRRTRRWSASRRRRPDARRARAARRGPARAGRGGAGARPALAGLAGGSGRGAGYLVADVAAELSSYAADVDADPARLAAVYERRAALRGLIRKYAERRRRGAGLGRAAPGAAGRPGRLRRAAGGADRPSGRARRAAGRAGRAELGRAAGGRRAASAPRSPPSWPGWRCRTRGHRGGAARAAPVPADRSGPDGVAVGPDGADEVELPAAATPARPLPLQKGASGGELSRVMLAVEVVFAGADPVPTLVFDEVDAGVGGRAAVEVGRRLARLARTTRCSWSPTCRRWRRSPTGTWWWPRSDDDGAVTTSGVRVAGRHRPVRELARMLAGLQDSDLGRARRSCWRWPRDARRGHDAGPDGRLAPGLDRAPEGPIGEPGPAVGSGPRIGGHAVRNAPRSTRGGWHGCACHALRGAEAPLTGRHRHGPLDRRTKRWSAARPGEIAVIDHVDLDRVARRRAGRRRGAGGGQRRASITGRYPNLGPEILVEAGHPAARRGRGRGLSSGPRGRDRAARRRRALPRRGEDPVATGRAAGRGDRRRRRWTRPGPGCRPSSRRSPRTRWSTCAASGTCCSTASAFPEIRPADRRPARADRGARLRLPGRPGRAAALHPRVPAGADRRRRRRGRAGRGRLPAGPDHRRHGLGDRRRAAGGAEVVVHAYPDGRAPGAGAGERLGVPRPWCSRPPAPARTSRCCSRTPRAPR